MESRAELKRRVEALIRKTGTEDSGEVFRLRLHPVCLMTGELADTDHEITTQLSSELKARYGTSHSFHIICARTDMEAEIQAVKLSEAIREAVEGGFASRTGSVSLSIFFLLSDPACLQLPGYLKKLEERIQTEGNFSLEVDFYGLIDYTREECGSHWRIMKPWLISMSARGDGICLCSRDGMARSQVFGRAIEAVALTVFMKTVDMPEAVRRVWERKPKSLLEGGKILWKSLCYWKLDLELYSVCRYILEKLSLQLCRNRGEVFKREKIDCTEEYLEKDRVDWECETENILLGVPVSRECLNLLTACAKQESKELPALFKRLFRDPKETEMAAVTYETVLNRLFGGEEALRRLITEEDKENGRELEGALKKILQEGSAVEAECLPDIANEISRRSKERKRKAEEQWSCLLKENSAAFLKSEELFFRQCMNQLMHSLAELLSLERVYTAAEQLQQFFSSEDFEKKLREHKRRLEEQKQQVQMILADCLPDNHGGMCKWMEEYEFYDKTEQIPSWNEDIFNTFYENREFRAMMAELQGRMKQFAGDEGGNIISGFREEIWNMYGGIRKGNDEAGFYLLKGYSGASDENRNEFLMAGKAFEKEILSFPVYEKGIFRMNQIAGNICRPFTLEFLGVYESTDTSGIQGVKETLPK